MLKDTGFIFFWMIFMHIVDDYYLQGILAQMKQKKWWIENAPQDLYKNDYKIALLCHGFSWAFMIMLPLAISCYSEYWCVFVFINMIIHCFIDNLKANELKINLATDQALHIVQLLVSWILYIVLIWQ